MAGKRIADPARRPAPATPNGSAIAAGLLVLAVWLALAVALHRRNAVWESQRALWTDALEKAPCDARAHLSLGFTFREKQKYAEAIEEYRKGLDCAQDNLGMQVQLLRNLGAALIWSGRFAEATDVLEQTAAKIPPDPEILTNLAVSWLGRKDMPRAREAAKRAIAASTDPGPALNVLGLVQLEEGDLAGARVSFERAVAADPDRGTRGFNLGRVLERQGDLAGACAAWRRAYAGQLDHLTQRNLTEALAKCGGAR